MEWEGTLDSSRMIEALSDDTLVFHQVHKRVWPSAQRDTCFWSHIRSVEHKAISPDDTTYPDWIVVNYSTNHDQAPVNKRRYFFINLIFSLKISNNRKVYSHVAFLFNPFYLKQKFIFGYIRLAFDTSQCRASLPNKKYSERLKFLFWSGW